MNENHDPLHTIYFRPHSSNRGCYATTGYSRHAPRDSFSALSVLKAYLASSGRTEGRFLVDVDSLCIWQFDVEPPEPSEPKITAR